MSFSDDLAAFKVQSVEEADRVRRKIILDLFSNIVRDTPVGNPDLWKSNQEAVTYNNEVSAYNAALRDNPENLDKRGRLKRGRKLNDGMDLPAGKGYVGGRLRSNWITSVSAPAEGTLPNTNSGKKTGAELSESEQAAIRDHINEGDGTTCLTNNLPYAERCEFGWSKQAPEGMVRRNIASLVAIVKNAKRGTDL